MNNLDQTFADTTTKDVHVHSAFEEYRLDSKHAKSLLKELKSLGHTELEKLPLDKIDKELESKDFGTKPALKFIEKAEPAVQPNVQSFFDRCVTFGEHTIEKAQHEGESHPWLISTAAIVGTAALFAATKGYASRFFRAEKELDVAAQVIERDAVLSKVGTIPDVARPQLEALTTSGVPAEFEKAAAEYRLSLTSLKNLPTHYKLNQAEWLEDIAARSLKDRSAITGEFVTPENVNKELQRISELNPETILPANKLILVHDPAAISKFAEITQYKHVPQLGQFLKQFGVSESNIQEAFKIQSAVAPQNRPLLGQVLVDDKLALKEQVDQAFEQQNNLKAILKKVREEAFH